MIKQRPCLRAVIPISRPTPALLTTLAVVQLCSAEIIAIDPTTGVTASSEIGTPFNRQDDFLVDGSGLLDGQHTPTVQPNMWLSIGSGFGGVDPDPSVTFDLGAVYRISSIHVWNYNESPPNLTNRGVNALKVEYGATADLGSTLAEITNLSQADGTPTYAGETFDNFAPFSARFIKFDIDSNHGDGNTFYGLSEVQFDGVPDGLTLSPSTFTTSSSQGAAVGTLATPAGDAGDTFTYMLIVGEGDTDNGKFQIAGDKLQIGPHDFSGAAHGEEFSVRVLSTGAPSGTVVETALTLTALADSDTDDLLDTWEERWAGAGNLEVLSGLAGANADGDTLTDLEEFNLREQFPDLDPTSADTDEDGLDDGEEIAGAGERPETDPTDPDSDGDNLNDGVETNTGIFVDANDTGSNPTLVDTDSDTFPDDLEVVKGSDPNDPDSTPPVSLVGYWPFDSDSDPQPDLSDFANNASVFGGVSWVDDSERGGVMEFDGNDSYLEAADSTSLSIIGDLTIAAWINVTDFAGFRGIVGKTGGAAGNLPASYDLYLLQNGGQARLYTGSPDPGAFAQVTATTVPTVGEWHHIAVTRIGNEVIFYYDGQLDGLGTAPQPLLDSDAVLRIGNRTDLVTDFLGRMDDVAIWDGGLTADEIMDVMNGDFSAWGVGPGGDPLELSVTQSDPELVFEWRSRDGMLYNLRSNTDLAADLATWEVIEVDEVFDIPASGTGTNTHSIVLPGDPARYYRVVEFPAPPLLEENFDGVAGPGVPEGWSTTGGGATAWEVGDPSGGVGPPAARSAPNCAGTNIIDIYAPSADVSLRSPVIQIPASGATLSYQQFIDTDQAGDVGTIRILDADAADALIEELDPPGAIEGFLAGWTAESFPLPESAHGRNIRIEFRFVSNDNADEWAGFYIDDVRVDTN